MTTARPDATPAATSAAAAPPPLEQTARRLHRVLIEAVIATGRIPSVFTLAGRLGTTEAAVRAGLATLAAADYLSLNGSGQVSCLYPLSPTPTAHAVSIDGQPRYAMCAIDALGMPAMLDRELDIASRCAVCDAPIAVRIRPGVIVTVNPAEVMVVARGDESEPAFAACCPLTVFVCGQPHAEQFRHRSADTHALTLTEALTHGEHIFASLLADALPATRPRSKGLDGARDG